MLAARNSFRHNSQYNHKRSERVILTAYMVLGVFAGLLAGLLGVGGGLIIVPALLVIFTNTGFNPSVVMHMAIATSLASIVITSMISAYAHHRHAAVQWRDVRLLTPGLLVGAALGAFLADGLSNQFLKICFALFEIAVAMQMLFSFMPGEGNKTPGHLLMSLAGLITGGLSAVLGIGGGTITVPFLYWCGRNIKQAVATSSACGLPIALSGTLFYSLFGLDEQALPHYTLGYLYWPAFLFISAGSLLSAPFGAKLAHQLPVVMLKKIFATLLFFIGMRMLLS